MLEREVGTGLVVDSEGRCVIGLVADVRPNPLAHGDVARPVVDVHAGVVVDAVKPQTTSIGACLPVARTHAVEREVGACVGTVVGCAARAVLKRPVMTQEMVARNVIARYIECRGWYGGFGRVWTLPRKDQPVRSSALEELDSEVMQSC